MVVGDGVCCDVRVAIQKIGLEMVAEGCRDWVDASYPDRLAGLCFVENLIFLKIIGCKVLFVNKMLYFCRPK